MKRFLVFFLFLWVGQAMALSPLPGWWSDVNDPNQRLNLDLRADGTAEVLLYAPQNQPTLYQAIGPIVENDGPTFAATDVLATFQGDGVSIVFQDNRHLTVTVNGIDVDMTKDTMIDPVEDLLTGNWHYIRTTNFGYINTDVTTFEESVFPFRSDWLPFENGTLYRLTEPVSAGASGPWIYFWHDLDRDQFYMKVGWTGLYGLMLNRGQYRVLIYPDKIVGYGQQSLRIDSSGTVMPTEFEDIEDFWILVQRLPPGWTCLPDDLFPSNGDCVAEQQQPNRP